MGDCRHEFTIIHHGPDLGSYVCKKCLEVFDVYEVVDNYALDEIQRLQSLIDEHNKEHHSCDCIAAIKGGDCLNTCASRNRIEVK